MELKITFTQSMSVLQDCKTSISSNLCWAVPKIQSTCLPHTVILFYLQLFFVLFVEIVFPRRNRDYSIYFIELQYVHTKDDIKTSLILLDPS